MGFVLVFLVCHFPRLLLNIHELITLREFGAIKRSDSNTSKAFFDGEAES